ncbi:unnamed protein product [Oikopleura dioica]|nr:unnamed protein product [Oikopleura dioica]
MGQYENNDDFIFRLNVYSDATFSSRFKMQEFPLLKSLKERIFLGTEVITKMQHEYIFTKRCWATPSVDTESNIAYSPIIDNGCPSDAFTSLQARSNHEDRFSTETLRFPESNYVYIQCDVIVCDLRKPNDKSRKTVHC